MYEVPSYAFGSRSSFAPAATTAIGKPQVDNSCTAAKSSRRTRIFVFRASVHTTETCTRQAQVPGIRHTSQVILYLAQLYGAIVPWHAHHTTVLLAWLAARVDYKCSCPESKTREGEVGMALALCTAPVLGVSPSPGVVLGGPRLQLESGHPPSLTAVIGQ